MLQAECKARFHCATVHTILFVIFLYSWLYIHGCTSEGHSCVNICFMSLISVERVFKFVGSVPQGDDVRRKDLLVCFPRSATDPSTCM